MLYGETFGTYREVMRNTNRTCGQYAVRSTHDKTLRFIEVLPPRALVTHRARQCNRNTQFLVKVNSSVEHDAITSTNDLKCRKLSVWNK